MPNPLGSVAAQGIAQEMTMADADASRMFFSSAIKPQQVVAVPPNQGDVPNFGQPVKTQGTWKANDDTYNPEVSSQAGQIVWLPTRGMISLTRYGFVAAGITTAESPTAAANFVSAWSYTTAPTFYPAIGTLTYVSEFAVPYTSVAPWGTNSDILSFSPDVAADFYLGRLTTGIFNLRAGATALNQNFTSGRAAMGNISDTRDIAQDSRSTIAFEPTSLASASVIGKDGDASFPLQDGAVSLQGSDIAREFRPPNMDIVGERREEYDYVTPANISVLNPSVMSILSSANTVNGAQGILQSYWISPWKIQASGNTAFVGSTQGNAGPIINIPTTAIDENGVLDLQLTCQWSLSQDNLQPYPQPMSYQIGASVEAWFVSAHEGTSTTPHNLYYQSIMLMEWGPPTTIPAGAPISPLPFQGPNYFTPGMFNIDRLFRARGGTAVLGKFVGLCLSFNVRTPEKTIVQLGYTVNITNIGLTIISPTSGVAGNVGPAHIIQWRDVSSGQELVVDGTLNCQTVANANISQFTKTAVQGSNRATNVNVIPMLAHAFDSDETALRRMWKYPDYQAFIAPFATDPMTTADVVNMLGRSSSAAGSAAAAGLHAGLLGDLGNVIGQRFGGGAGARIGGMIGNLADRALGTHAAGMFGSYSSSAGSSQFAAPMTFAAGSYGGRRSMFGSDMMRGLISDAANEFNAAARMEGTDDTATAAMRYLPGSRRLRE